MRIFPSTMALQSRSELEEERRLFYVAVTSAKKTCSLSYALTRYKWGQLIQAEPSRFIEEIDPACVTMPSAQASKPNPFAGGGDFEKQRNNWKSMGTASPGAAFGRMAEKKKDQGKASVNPFKKSPSKPPVSSDGKPLKKVAPGAGNSSAPPAKASSNHLLRLPASFKSLMYARATRMTAKYNLTRPGPLRSSSSLPTSDSASVR